MSRLKFIVFIVILLAIFSSLTSYAQEGTEATLREYATDTWASLVAMHPTDYLLVADGLERDGSATKYTSPTNIASYLWSTLAARDLSLIDADEAYTRIEHELTALGTLERDSQTGQFYNWYSPLDGTVLIQWPGSTNTVCPFLSSVDNAWLAASLMMIRQAVPDLADAASQILDTMHFDFYYDANEGQFWGGYWPPDMQPNSSCDTGFTGHHYGVLNSETRIISYVSIALGQVPATQYFKLARTFPPTCDWSWQEMKPEGDYVVYNVHSSLPSEPEAYQDVKVYEGYYTYHDIKVVPSWGGAMFEALMNNLIVPEAEWGIHSWAINHPRFVQAQIEHGLNEAQYGYWGFSPSSDPKNGYREYGVDALGMDSNGYTSDEKRTTVDYGFAGCSGRSGQSIPDSKAYVMGVVTPHAVFLALEFAPEAALENLANLHRDFNIYDEQFGFYDAVQVNNGLVARRFLALDQGMIMLSLVDYLSNGDFKHYFADEIESTIKPLLEMETFGSD